LEISYALVPALQHLVDNLGNWNREVFSNLFCRKQKTWARLEGIEKRLSAGGPRHLLNLETKLRKDLTVILNQIETFWFQKSRMEAICDGDRNTRYFHINTIIRRHFNRIETLKHNDGHWVTEADEVKRLVIDYFASLFTESMAQPRNDLPTGRFP